MQLFSISNAIGALAIILSLSAPVAQAQTNKPAGDSLDGCPSQTILSRFIQFGKTGKMPKDLGKWLGNPKAQAIVPYQAFDNVQYVGVCWVSAWLIKTSDGFVLIDTLHEPFVDQLIGNIAKAGVDLADIKYVLMTHGHFDHVGGAHKLKPLVPNAKFVMTQTGWDEAIKDAAASKSGRRPWTFLEKIDVVVKDSEELTLGDATFTAYETPGHTFGTASYGFKVKDGDTMHHAFTVGGLGLNAIKSAKQVEAYISSIKRIQALADSKPVTVHLTTHAFSTRLTESARMIPDRKPGEPHPLVDPAGFKKQLAGLKGRAEKRLVREKKKEATN